MSDFNYLSKLVKDHLPEGKVNSLKFTQGVIESYSHPDALKRLKRNIGVAETMSQIHRRVDPEALYTRISPDPYS